MNDTAAQQKNKISSSPVSIQSVPGPSGGVGGIERERVSVGAAEQSLSSSRERVPFSERPPVEAKAVPVQEIVELPPDIKQFGSSPTPASAAVQVPALPAVQLPIPDRTVMRGLHAKITSPLAWLAIWCVRKLQKAHIVLKVIGRKVVRAPES